MRQLAALCLAGILVSGCGDDEFDLLGAWYGVGPNLPEKELCLIFCGNAKQSQSHDAVELGFAEAFSRLTIPYCDGCVCVGKLRLSKVYQLDMSVIKEMLGL